MLTEAVEARLKSEVESLGQRVDGAASWTKITSARELPQRTPCAFVLPLGKQGGEVSAITGFYRQEVISTIAVLVIVRSNDARGDKGAQRFETVLEDIEIAICGWQPPGETDCFSLRRAELLSSQNGALVYQIDFSIPQQMRI